METEGRRREDRTGEERRGRGEERRKGEREKINGDAFLRLQMTVNLLHRIKKRVGTQMGMLVVI